MCKLIYVFNWVGAFPQSSNWLKDWNSISALDDPLNNPLKLKILSCLWFQSNTVCQILVGSNSPWKWFANFGKHFNYYNYFEFPVRVIDVPFMRATSLFFSCYFAGETRRLNNRRLVGRGLNKLLTATSHNVFLRRIYNLPTTLTLIVVLYGVRVLCRSHLVSRYVLTSSSYFSDHILGFPMSWLVLIRYFMNTESIYRLLVSAARQDVSTTQK